MPTSVKVENWDGVTPPALPANWVNTDGALATVASGSRSSPNSLRFNTGSSGQKLATYGDPTTILRDVVVSTWFQLAVGTTTQVNVQVTARLSGPNGSASTLAQATAYYIAYVVCKPSATSFVGLDKKAGGTLTTLGTVNWGAALATGTYYRLVLTANGTGLIVQVQRATDSFWLNASGTFVSDPGGTTAAISLSDSSVSSPGYSGVGFFAPSNTNGITFTDDWELDTFAGPLVAGSCYVRRVSDTSLSIDATPCQQGIANYTYQVQKSTDGVTFADFGSPQTGVTPGTSLTTVTDTGLTTDTPYYYRVHQTDSEGSPVTVTTNVASLAPRPTGRTYYVDPAGSDANTGLATNAAWQTLAHATAYGLTPGDSLLLKGGATHTGSLLFYWVAGTYTAPVTISSYGTGVATISCGDSYGLRLVHVAAPRISNLIIQGSGASSSGVSTSLYNGLEIINPDGTGQLSTCYVDNVEVTGCYSGIEVRGSAATGAVGGSGYSDVRVTNCYAHEVLYFGVQVRCLVLLASDGSLLTWNSFSLVNDRGSASNNYQLFAGLAFTGVLVQDCRVLHSYGDPLRNDNIHSGDGVMVKQTQFGLIERCSAFDCGAHGYGPAGIWLQEDTDCAIRWCEVGRQGSKTNVDGDGFDMDGGCVRCVTEYCYSHDCQGADYLCGPYTGAAAPVNCTIRYCVGTGSVKNTNATSSVFPYGSAQLDIYNCVFRVDSTGASAVAVIRHSGGRQRMWNNILLTNRTDALPFLLGTFNNGSLAIGNVYHDSGSGGPKWNWAGTDYATFAAFLAGSAQETLNGITVGQYADPLLSSPGSHPDVMPTHSIAVGLTAFDETANSPTIGAGVDLYAVYGIDPGKIDLHGLPNRAEVDLTHTGIDVGPTKYGTASLIPGGGGAGAFPTVGCAFIQGV